MLCYSCKEFKELWKNLWLKWWCSLSLYSELIISKFNICCVITPLSAIFVYIIARTLSCQHRFALVICLFVMGKKVFLKTNRWYLVYLAIEGFSNSNRNKGCTLAHIYSQMLTKIINNFYWTLYHICKIFLIRY